MPLLFKKFSIIVPVLAFFLGIMTYDVLRFFLHPFDSPQTITYVVEPGDSLVKIAKDLHSNYQLSSPYYLITLGVLRGDSDHIQVGEYEFPNDIKAHKLLRTLVKGKVKQHHITLIEGWTVAQVLEAIHQAPFLTHTLKTLPPQFSEGLLFPDTYFFPRGTTDLAVLERAFQTMQQHLERLWQTRQANLPYKMAYEGLIIASLVETEAVKNNERARIAGVFVNRLQKDMRLDSDPTVVYALGKQYKGVLTNQLLKVVSPYNTYTIKGLPPTPIACPGLRSLYAAFNPEKTSALYFVANGNGEHIFSDTLQEHSKARKQSQWKKDAS